MNTHADDILVEYSLFDIRRIVKGLMSPGETGEHKLAVMAVTRLFGPVTVSLLISGLVLGALLALVKARIIDRGPDRIAVDIINPDTMKADDRAAVERDIDSMISRSARPQGPAAFEPTSPADPGIDFKAPDPFIPEVRPLPQGAPDAIRLKGPILVGLFDNRINGEVRQKAMDDFGADKDNDAHVLAALRWLKKKQDPDGSWKTASDVDPLAMTGLAALAFLAHGETPQQSKEFGPALESALRYLMSVQQADGRFSANSYTHAIATYALAEAFALTRIMELREPMEKGVAFIIKGQQDEGGFDYGYAKAARFDTSVAGWNIQALKAAYTAGSVAPGLKEAAQRSVRFLKTQAYAQNGSGFVYSGTPGVPAPGGGRWSMTGVGTLGLQILGHAMDPEARQGIACLDPLACDWPAAREAKPSVYGWYYVTQAKFHKGGSVWHAWNSQFKKAYIERQVMEPDGCGYWAQGDHGGAVYATTLATLTLEVYYRYLPTYKIAEVETSAAGRDDVKIEVL